MRNGEVRFAVTEPRSRARASCGALGPSPLSLPSCALDCDEVLRGYRDVGDRPAGRVRILVHSADDGGGILEPIPHIITCWLQQNGERTWCYIDSE